MKRSLRLWLVMALVYTIVFPIHSIAGNLNLVTKDGYNILIGAPMKGFFVDEVGNLTAEVDVNKADLTSAANWYNFDPTISLSTFTGCTGDDSTGIINGTKGTELSFKVLATDADQTDTNKPKVSCIFPTSVVFPPDLAEATFTNTYATAGTYLAIFKASFTPPNGTEVSTKRVLKIVISDPAQQFSLNVSVSGSGTVSKNPDQATYANGSSVTLTATPTTGTGAVFSGWSGDASGNTNPLTVTMNGNKNITATFTTSAPTTYTLTLNVNPAGAGTVYANPQKTSYSAGESVSLTATPAGTYTFSSWSEGTSPVGTSNPQTIYINGNRTITANFNAAGGGGTGAYSAQVAEALKFTRELSVNGGGVFPEVRSIPGKVASSDTGYTTLYRGQKIYFYVGPTGIFPTGSLIRFTYIDYTQSLYGPIKSTLYVLDANNDLITGLRRPSTNPSVLDAGTGYNYIDYPYYYHTSDKRYLIEIDTTGMTASQLGQFKIYLSF